MMEEYAYSYKIPLLKVLNLVIIVCSGLYYSLLNFVFGQIEAFLEILQGIHTYRHQKNYTVAFNTFYFTWQTLVQLSPHFDICHHTFQYLQIHLLINKTPLGIKQIIIIDILPICRELYCSSWGTDGELL